MANPTLKFLNSKTRQPIQPDVTGDFETVSDAYNTFIYDSIKEEGYEVLPAEMEIIGGTPTIIVRMHLPDDPTRNREVHIIPDTDQKVQ
jgi:hypothetical protein